MVKYIVAVPTTPTLNPSSEPLHCALHGQKEGIPWQAACGPRSFPDAQEEATKPGQPGNI